MEVSALERQELYVSLGPKNCHHSEVSVLQKGRHTQESMSLSCLHYRGRNCMYLFDRKNVQVRKSVTVNNNSPIQDSVYTDDQTQPFF